MDGEYPIGIRVLLPSNSSDNQTPGSFSSGPGGKDTSDLQVLSYFQIHRKQSITRLTLPLQMTDYDVPCTRETEEVCAEEPM